jgi:methionine-rich copper-binding protein CopC
MLSGMAGFLAGLLGTARPSRTALALGGLTTVLTLLIATAMIGVVTIAGLNGPDDAERIWAGGAPVTRLFTCLASYPMATIGLSWASARIGRTFRGWLGLKESPPALGSGTGTSVAVPASGQPAWLRRGVRTPVPRVDTRGTGSGSPPASRLPRPRGIAAWPRILLLAFGGLLLATASCDLLRSRARFTRSDPAAGAVLATPPATVRLHFSGALAPSCELRVRRTVTIGPSGEQVATGGTPVARASGPDALGDGGHTLHVRIPEDSGGGLYVVDWNTTSATAGHAQRFGSLYFGVGMPVPEFIVREGVSREEDPGERGRRKAMLGGLVCIAIGLAWPLLLNARAAGLGSSP